MRNKKFLTTLILTLSLVCSTLLGASLIGVSASTTAPSFAITDGAYIRYDAPVGISFETKILKTEYESLQAKNAQYGTVIIPSHLLGENELTVTLDAENNVISGVKSGLVINATSINTTVEDNAETTEINENLYNYYYAVVIGDKSGDTWLGLPEALYGTTLVARSYVVFDGEDGREIEYAENLSTRSLAEVAKNAIVGGKLTAEQLTACHSITETGAKKLTAVNVNTALAEINSNIVLGNGDTSVLGVYVVDFGVEIDSVNYSISNGTLSFTDDYMKNLSYGTYTLKIFTDKGVYLVETNVYGEVEATEAVLTGFDSSSTISQFIVDSSKVQTQWLPEFQGASGVIKATFTDQWWGVKIAVPYTVEQLKAMSWNFLDIKMYTEMDGDVYEGGWPSATTGAWSVVRYSKEALISQFKSEDAFYTALSTGSARLFAFWNTDTAYIDYVEFVLVEEFDGKADFNNKTSVDSVYYGADTAEYLPTYQGATGVIKGAYASDWVGIQFRLNTTVEKLQAMSWDYVEFKMTVDFTGGRNSWDGFYPWNDPPSWWTYTTDGVWRIYRANKADVVAQFGSLDNFYTAITVGLSNNDSSRMFVLYNMRAHGNFYFDYFNLESYETINDFTTSDSVNQFVNNGDMINVGWEGDFQNANGVIKATNNAASYGDVVAIKATSGFLYAYKNATWTSIEFVVWVEKAVGDTSTKWQFSTSSFIGADWPGGKYGEWTTISYTKEAITNNGKLDSLYTKLSNGTVILETNDKTLQGATIYIDCIRLV